MDAGTILLLATVISMALFVLGSPMLLVMGLWVVAAHVAYDFPLQNLGASMFEGLNSFALLAAPLFILTGDLIGGGGIARRIINFTLAALSWLRGGLAMASISASGFFAAISGSNAATTATIGSITYPAMVKEKYGNGFAAATAAAGGTVGIIIPPSILFIVYGYLVNVPISELFLAGIGPGILLVVSMLAVAFLVCRRYGYGTLRPFSLVGTLQATPGFMLAVFAVALVLWGLYTGVFSPTEAAAVTVVYCLFAGFFLTRELTIRELPNLVFRSGMIIGIIMPLVAVSLVMQQMFAVIGINTAVAGMLQGLGNYYAILFTCMLVVFIAGMFLESVPITIIFAPIMAPVIVKAGGDPFHFAVVFVVGTAIGFVTPPFGLNLFVASSISGVPYLSISRFVMPYLLALLFAWLLIALVPALSTFIVGFAGLAGGGLMMN
jgi:C4-dicarboxylate transporter, DctM subunit